MEGIDAPGAGGDSDGDAKAVPKPLEVIEIVERLLGVTMQEMAGSKRNRAISDGRRLAVHLLRDLMRLTYAEIGTILGDRDHTTVIHLYSSGQRLCAENPYWRNLVQLAKEELKR